MSNALIVAANNREDTSWTDSLSGWELTIGTAYHPKGREADTYLRSIIYWSKLDVFDEVVFCQGNPFGHDNDFIEHLNDPAIRYYGTIHECNRDGAPAYEAPLHLFCEELGLPTPETFKFVAGSQYRVTREQINRHTKDFYGHMLDIAHKESKAPWIFERLWPLVWEITL